MFSLELPVLALGILVHTVDFIPDAAREHFVGFEDSQIPCGSPYVEDEVEVAQVQADTLNQQINCHWDGGPCSGPPPEGMGSWWPIANDHGYTRIRRVSGGDFFAVGLYRSTGACPHAIPPYELWNDGKLVLADTTSHGERWRYIGFSGGGFDEIRIRDAYPLGYAGFYDGSINALAIDAVELSAEVTAVADDAPASSFTAEAFPNPTRDTVTLKVVTQQMGKTTIQVFDVTGRLIASPFQGVLPAGTHGFKWPAEGEVVRNGIYFVRTSRSSGIAVQRVLLLRW